MAINEDTKIRRRPKLQTKQAILDTAVEMIDSDGIPERVDLRLSSVLGRMGLTTGAAYNIWANQEEFQRDLGLALLSDLSWAGPEVNAIDFEPRDNDPEAELKRLAKLYFKALTSRERYFVALQFWGVRQPSADLQDAILQGFRSNEERWAQFYSLGLDWAGLQLRSPFTMAEFANAVAMVTEGAAIRHRFDPEALESDLYSEMLVAILRHFTEAKPTA
jgi:hypothetical protein